MVCKSCTHLGYGNSGWNKGYLIHMKIFYIKRSFCFHFAHHKNIILYLYWLEHELYVLNNMGTGRQKQGIEIFGILQLLCVFFVHIIKSSTLHLLGEQELFTYHRTCGKCSKLYIGPSGAVQTVSDSRRPLFLLFFHFLLLGLVQSYLKPQKGKS